MKAVVQSAYGRPDDVLELRDVEKPLVADDEVLVHVQAASVHPDIWHVLSGLPYMLRAMGAGLRRPKYTIPGTDMAGIVESVGKDVTRFESGDEVFGESVKGHQWHNGGAFAEYVSVREEALMPKPANVTFEQASTVPTAGLIALRGVREEGRVQSGQKVLVNGAGGGVGMLSVQLAKACGAEVTAIDLGEKLDMLRSIGADAVIDYTREDFTRNGECYDVIIDIPGNRSFSDLKRSLAEDGRYVLIGHDNFGDSGHRWIGAMGRFLKLTVLAPFGRRRKDRAPKPTEDPLTVLTSAIEAGEITPVVGRTFPLAQVPDAMRCLAEGHTAGRVVITV